MRLVPVANAQGHWVYLSPVDSAGAVVVATLLFGLVLSLALVSLNLYHQLSLLRLITSQAPRSSLHSSNRNTASALADVRFPSYWSDREHLPPISPLRKQLYLCVDLVCLCFDHICYTVAWGRWIAAALWFQFKSLMVFLLAEIPYRCKLLHHAVVALTPNQWVILGGILILCFVLGGFAVFAGGTGFLVLALVLTASPAVAPPSPSLPPAKLFDRYQSATNPKKLGPGFCPDTPTRPMWSLAPVNRQQTQEHKHPPPPTQRQLFQHVDHGARPAGDDLSLEPSRSHRPSQSLPMQQVSNPRRRVMLQSPAKKFRPTIVLARPRSTTCTISGDTGQHGHDERPQRLSMSSHSQVVGVKGTPFAPQHPSRLRSVANANLTSSSASSNGSVGTYRQASPSRGNVLSIVDRAPFEPFFSTETPVVPQRRRRPVIETPVIPPSAEGDLLRRAPAFAQAHQSNALGKATPSRDHFGLQRNDRSGAPSAGIIKPPSIPQVATRRTGAIAPTIRDRPNAGQKADRYTSITEISTPSFLVPSGHMEDRMRRYNG